jgi:DNA-directed RNA polymerase subunit RPC12/RpoP
LLAALGARLFGSNTAGGYQRVVTPESDLKVACRRCGHVSRAFDSHCPQCGGKLSGRAGWGGLWMLGAAFVGMIVLSVLYSILSA